MKIDLDEPQIAATSHIYPFRVNIKNIYFRTHKQFQNSTTLRIANERSRYFTWPLNTLKMAVMQKRRLIYTAIKRPFF